MASRFTEEIDGGGVAPKATSLDGRLRPPPGAGGAVSTTFLRAVLQRVQHRQPVGRLIVTFR